jgi:hypothetical protein
MAGLNERLLDENAVFFEGETTVTTVTSAALNTGTGGQLGATKIILRANEAINLADTKTITITAVDSAEEAGTFVSLVSSVVTASGATQFAAGAVISEVILPRTSKEWTKVTFATDETVPSGTFDAFCSSPTGLSNV